MPLCYHPEVKKDKSQRIVAEIGLTHEGSVGFAENFIKCAKANGADTIKFQMHDADAESSPQETFRIHFSKQDDTRQEYWRRTSFSSKNWHFLIQLCEEINVKPQISVFSSDSLKFALELGISQIKLGSGDLCNAELAESINEYFKDNKNLELTLSTGMATWSEIDGAMDAYSNLLKHDKLILLQCTSMYPTPLEKVGIDSMLKMKKKYNVRVGLSDHTPNLSSAYLALALGAEVIEKHVCFDRRMFGPDISSSITFGELETLCKYRDDLAILFNKSDKDSISGELIEQKRVFGRSLSLRKSLKVGEMAQLEDFVLVKPGGGLDWSTRNLLVGKRASRDVEKGQIIEMSWFA